MKLSARDAAAYFRKPDASAKGLLIFGADPVRVSAARKDVTEALLGAGAEEEMRLTRLAAADLRKDPAALLDAVKAVGFFPGARAVVVEDAADGMAPVVSAALEDWQPGDAQIIVTAGSLAAKSKLRKAFEGDARCHAAGLYDAPPDRGEIDALLGQAGLAGRMSGDGMAALTELSRIVDPGDFRQSVEKLGLYMMSTGDPAGPDEVAACAPASAEADLDDVLNVVAGSETGKIGPLLRRLYAQGVQPVGICIGATRHFRRLHAAASDPGGAAQGAARLRPPVFGPRRDLLVRQASQWGHFRLEQALTLLYETDLSLRSRNPPPARALVERTLIRLSMMGRSR